MTRRAEFLAAVNLIGGVLRTRVRGISREEAAGLVHHAACLLPEDHDLLAEARRFAEEAPRCGANLPRLDPICDRLHRAARLAMEPPVRWRADIHG